MDGIINTVLMMVESGLPCFSRGEPIGNLRKRFHPEMSVREAANFMIQVMHVMQQQHKSFRLPSLGPFPHGNLGNLLLIVVPAICTQEGSPFEDHSVCKTKWLDYSSFSVLTRDTSLQDAMQKTWLCDLAPGQYKNVSTFFGVVKKDQFKIHGF